MAPGLEGCVLVIMSHLAAWQKEPMGADVWDVTDITTELCQGMSLVLSRMALFGGKNAFSWCQDTFRD